jgi:hypothetical protein
VYLSFSNIRSKYKYDGKHIHTYLLIPHGVDIYEALEPLRKELHDIEERGFEIVQHDGTRVRVFGCVSLEVADHPQACQNCALMRGSPDKNCRMCYVERKNCAVISHHLLDHKMTRRSGKAEATRAQMELEMSVLKSKKDKKAVRSKYGDDVKKPLLGGLTDPHTQCLICVPHCLEIGTLLRLHNFALGEISAKHRDTFRHRLACLDDLLPRRWVKFGNSFVHFGGKFSQPMSTIVKFTFFAEYLYGGLVDGGVVECIWACFRVRHHLMKVGHTDETVRRV